MKYSKRRPSQTGPSGTRSDAAPRAGGSKLGAEKLTPEEQRRRFIEAAREAGASESEADLDRTLGAIVKPVSGR